MNDDYLWERKGSDAEIERLENALRPLGLVAREHRKPRRRWIPLAAAAAVLAAAAGIGTAWYAAVPRFSVDTDARSFRVAEGSWVAETGSARVIRLGEAGEVRADAGARVRVLRIGDEEQRLRLEFGTLHARIAGGVRPRFFQVETPAGTCVDLGCAYSLTVDAAGRSLVRVESGQVSFEDGGREVFVPADAECAAEPGRGPGIPRFTDSTAAFAAAAIAFDAASGTARAAAALALAAKAARPRDTLTLWHLLQEPNDEVRVAALDRIERLAGPCHDAPRAKTLAGDPQAVEVWRMHLEDRW